MSVEKCYFGQNKKIYCLFAKHDHHQSGDQDLHLIGTQTSQHAVWFHDMFSRNCFQLVLKFFRLLYLRVYKLHLDF
jgi:hypothetical protein